MQDEAIHTFAARFDTAITRTDTLTIRFRLFLPRHPHNCSDEMVSRPILTMAVGIPTSVLDFDRCPFRRGLDLDRCRSRSRIRQDLGLDCCRRRSNSILPNNDGILFSLADSHTRFVPCLSSRSVHCRILDDDGVAVPSDGIATRN